jgi:hypothetical protein
MRLALMRPDVLDRATNVGEFIGDIRHELMRVPERSRSSTHRERD